MSPDHQFPNTRWSVVLQAQGEDSGVRDRALEEICRAYWLPVYAFARGLGLQPGDAEDLTQNVLTSLLDRKAFERVSAQKGKLRSFLRVATKNYQRDEWRKAGARKRGGDATILSLEGENPEELCSLKIADGETPESIFDRHWGINLLNRTMDRLEAQYQGEDKGALFEVMKELLGQKGGNTRYRDLGEQLGMSEAAVKMAVHRLRKRYRRLLTEEIALTLDDESEEAVAEEIRYLFGVFAS